MKEGVMLVLGGARSGKSSHAERLVLESGLQPVYVATAEAGDAEMAARIALHRARRGSAWMTIEAPERLEDVLQGEAAGDRALLVDCLTLWLSNLLLKEADLPRRVERLVQALRELPGLTVCVSNEVGQGIVPDNALARRFRDAQGQLNQAVAAAAHRVVYMVAGLPMLLKG